MQQTEFRAMTRGNLLRICASLSLSLSLSLSSPPRLFSVGKGFLLREHPKEGERTNQRANKRAREGEREEEEENTGSSRVRAEQDPRME